MAAETSAYRDKEKQPDPITVSDIFPYFFESPPQAEVKPVASLPKRARAIARLEQDMKNGLINAREFGNEMAKLERKGASNGH